MADERPFSVTKVVASLGGAMLLASFFLPMVNKGFDVGHEMGIAEVRKQIESSRELQAVQPLIEPALQQIERFIATPSLRNLSGLAATSCEVLDAAASLGIDEADAMRELSTILGRIRLGLWSLPLVGLVQMVLPALSRMRGYTGYFGLVARFVFGLLFVLVAIIPLLGVPEAQQQYIGSAAWVLLFGGCLMMGASFFGVTRRNWWAVIGTDVLLFVLICVSIASLADAAKS